MTKHLLSDPAIVRNLFVCPLRTILMQHQNLSQKVRVRELLAKLSTTFASPYQKLHPSIEAQVMAWTEASILGVFAEKTDG